MIAPREPYPLIGRGEELAALRALQTQHRLLTLWGPGGVGKTRLAARLARELGERAVFCDLSHAGDELGLCAMIAQPLSLVLEAEPARSVARALQRRGPTALVLDNFEQLTHLAAAVLPRWLDAAPELSILVTSRERLRLPDEVCYELGPLRLPASDEDLLDAEAFQLLQARVRAIDPGFAFASAEHGALVALLRELEGMPLAIELAAARLPWLGVRALREQLAGRLDQLDHGMRGVPTRQTSLRESIRWSWDLLEPDAQRALMRLSTFRGGFPADAAEALLGPSGIKLLTTLRDCSLVRSPRAGRFALFDSVREFAAELLDRQGDRLEAATAHARWVADYCSRLARAADERGESIAVLLEERLNLEQALRWSIAAEQRATATTLALAFAPIASTHGPRSQYVDYLGQVLAMAPADPALLHARGQAALGMGRLAEAERDLLAASDHAQTVALRARVIKDQAVLHHQRRDVEQAERCYRQALELATQAREERLSGICVGDLGALRHDLGDYAAAAELYDQALVQLRSAGDLRTEGIFLTNRAVLHQEQGRFAAARADYLRALALLQSLGDRRAEGVALENMAVLEHLDDNLADSRAYHERALALLTRVDDERSEGLCRARLAAVLAQQGELVRASDELDRSAALLSRSDDPIAARVLPLYRAFIALGAGDRAGPMACLRAVRDDGSGASLLAVSDDARAAVKALQAWLAKGTRQRLQVAADCSWFQIADRARQSLAELPTHARIVASLVAAHDAGPAATRTNAELIEAGWPGERITPDAAANRLRVTLSQLRKLGLVDALERSTQGYRLDPAWLVLRGD